MNILNYNVPLRFKPTFSDEYILLSPAYSQINLQENIHGNMTKQPTTQHRQQPNPAKACRLDLWCEPDALYQICQIPSMLLTQQNATSYQRHVAVEQKQVIFIEYM